MAYPDHERRYEYRARHGSSLPAARDAADAHHRRAPMDRHREPAFYRSTPYHSYERARQHDTAARGRSQWPPAPSVEDEKASLAREVRAAGSWAAGDDGDGEAQARSRGSVDQYPIIEDVDPPASNDRRFVIVGGDLDEPPLFAARKPSPYAYTKPQKESLGRRDPDLHARDRDASPTRQTPIRERLSPSPPSSPAQHRDHVFEDSDTDAGADASHLRTARRPARYSFVKSDLQKEDLRTDVLRSQKETETRRRHTSPPSPARRDAYAPRGGKEGSSSVYAKQHTPPSDSPRSPSSPLNGGRGKARPSPLDTSYAKSSYHASSRPSSPRFHHASSPPRSPRLSPREPSSPHTSRPSSRSGRPSSPSHASRQPQRAPVTEVDWHTTYPPATDRSKSPTRPGRHDTVPIPMPKINVKSPSPARPRKIESELPYPVDHGPAEAFMPAEEQFQHDHSYTTYTPITTSPRPYDLDSPVLNSPRERLPTHRPHPSSRQSSTTEIPRSPRVRSNSVRSQTGGDDGRRERNTSAPLSLDKPLPSCPRSDPSAKYSDWYSLQDCGNFDICPSCFEGVFAGTPFARYFSQTGRYDRPIAHICDFSNPWMRLAWLLTIKQRRQSPDLLYSLATIMRQQRECPSDRELGTDHIAWYGISDPRDGTFVTNFAICPCDLELVEALFPSMVGYFTRIPSSLYAPTSTYTCSLRVTSRRFPKYLDLLITLDTEAQALTQRPLMQRFVQLARENAFRAECQRDKPLLHKAWHYIPKVPEFTVCQDCFDELVWPLIAPASSTSTSSPTLHSASASASASPPPPTIPKLFNRTIQPVPTEDPDLGSSCCLYSPRMRQIWECAVRDEDLAYLERKVLERKRAEGRITRERREILEWMVGLTRGSWEWEKARAELEENERRWRVWE